VAFRAICICLLDKNPSRRLGFAGLLMEPLFYAKTTGFPGGYRPKAIEERIRRSQARLLTSQIDSLMNSKNSSISTVAELVAENNRVKAETVSAAEAAAQQAFDEAQLAELSNSMGKSPPRNRNASRAGASGHSVRDSTEDGMDALSISSKAAASESAGEGEADTSAGQELLKLPSESALPPISAVRPASASQKEANTRDQGASPTDSISSSLPAIMSPKLNGSVLSEVEKEVSAAQVTLEENSPPKGSEMSDHLPPITQN
jgi:hypothetical protein